MRGRPSPAAARTYRRNFRRDAGEAEAPGEPQKGPGPRRWRSPAPAVRRCSRGPWWAVKGRPAEHERRAAGGEGGGGLLRLLRSAGRGCCRGSGGTEDAGKDNFQGWMTEPASLSAGAEQTQKKESVAIQLMKHEKEVGVPSNELGAASAATDQKEQSASEIRRDYVYSSTGRPEKTDMIKSLVTDQDASRNCKLYLPVSSSCSAMESSEDSEEDMYRDAEEIEREKVLLCETSSSEYKLSVSPEMDIMEYCTKEWRGNTPVAKRMRKLPENLLSKYDWIKQWQLKQKLGRKMGEISDEIKEYLILLRKKWKNISEIKGPIEKQEACDKLFKNEEEEYSLYEALKFLMLNTAIELYNDDKNGRRVPVFSWLLFARDTSSNPCQLMHNHLNHIGHSGGLEQVEMFLLAYALQYTIQVYRLYKYSTDEFITLYPNEPEEDWPVVTLITEDDRHYNIPVRMCQETML
ncbi:ubiquitin thioesterase otulin isoform X3 [Aquila chrysaetos chrysaetos]|uniref:ubiquitin thioesterase otulin isoform X3 n=1 Tax=Aquila chrysaetos chrysaetos TaxID=223781 RepID=UPI001B7D3658|nr:ubiquitin thioesterase otulin isoform X3 [Aquila chrysaetos chrysaetos]